jgi:lipopolysaccharide biosynthesis glycosyltransferase
MLASLFANGDIGDARVMIFGMELRASDKRKLRASCGPHGSRLEFIDVKSTHPTLEWLVHRWKAAHALYTRLIIPELLADVDDRLLYMDCDMLVVDSMRPLIDLDLGDCALAAVPDVERAHPAHDWREGRVAFPADAPYFNSGLILMDLAKWRERHLTQAVLDVFEREGERLYWADQDALNVALIGQWKPLDRIWNVHHIIAERLGGYDTAHIVHFTGGKPWSRECDHPLQSTYLEYRKLTPWARHPLESRFKRRWRKILGKRKASAARLWRRLTTGTAQPSPERPPAA